MEVLRKGRGLWSNSLVGYFLHSRLPFKVVEPIVHKLWGPLGLSKVLLHEKGYYIFKFNSAEDRANVLALGPWYIFNKQILLKHWKEGIDITRETCPKAPIWVKFRNIPLSYWNAEGLSYIASGVGKPLFFDKATENFEPLPYARLCVEIDVDAPLPSSLPVAVFDDEEISERSVVVAVEYQNRPPSCTDCKTFGHSLMKCPFSIHKVHKASAIPGLSHLDDEKIPASPPPAQPSSPAEIWSDVSGLQSPAISLQVHLPSSAVLLNSKNKFEVLGDFDMLSPECNTIPPPPNPLLDKLKIIDEKECRDLKLKAFENVVGSPSSKRKNKGRGRKSPT